MKEKVTSLKKVVQSELDKMSELQKDRDEFAQLALGRGKAIKVRLIVIKTSKLSQIKFEFSEVGFAE